MELFASKLGKVYMKVSHSEKTDSKDSKVKR